ncbi:MAG: LPS export ABC transporter periplasmic protein LptC [Candidatus Omnitrophica bacterium]|nr:LPS export ABC transporter periplasmic protein LptC [Candidatus Omnitrophota bacterium]
MRKVNLSILILILFTFTNCKTKKESIISNEEKFNEFSFRQFSKNYSFTIKGETAEINKNKDTQISSPSLSLKTKSEIIEIKTGKSGKGEIKIEQETRKIKEIIISGDVLILYKDLNQGNITMEITCGRATYIDDRKEMIFEEKPVIKRGKNKFSGEKIIYNIENNTIEIKGNVNVEIYPEEKTIK